MQMIKIKHNALLCLFVAAVVLLVCLTSGTLAWLSAEANRNSNINIGDFEAKAIPTIDGQNLYTVDGLFDENKGILSLNGVLKSKYTAAEQVGEYFVEDLHLDVLVNTDIRAYLRVKINTEWTLTRTYITVQRDPVVEAVYALSDFPYNLVPNATSTVELPTSDWMYDQATGYAYYTKVIEKGLNTIPFTDGAIGYNTSVSRNYVETCLASIGVVLELVQANRYEAIWNISQLPWEA